MGNDVSNADLFQQYPDSDRGTIDAASHRVDDEATLKDKWLIVAALALAAGCVIVGALAWFRIL